MADTHTLVEQGSDEIAIPTTSRSSSLLPRHAPSPVPTRLVSRKRMCRGSPDAGSHNAGQANT
jgi:hypothetical protein